MSNFNIFINFKISILDLSSNGNQPLIDKKSGTVLIYNGEIYNFRELQKFINPNHQENNDSKIKSGKPIDFKISPQFT